MSDAGSQSGSSDEEKEREETSDRESRATESSSDCSIEHGAMLQVVAAVATTRTLMLMMPLRLLPFLGLLISQMPP